MLYAVVASVVTLFGLVSGDATGLGRGFYLPDTSIIVGDNYGSGKSIFQSESVPKKCIKHVPSPINREEKSFFEDTQSFYSKIGLESSLSAELVINGFTLGASLESASNSVDSEKLNVAGMRLRIYASTGFSEFLPDCLTSIDLDDEFVAAFESLPAKIADPAPSRSWSEYDIFLKTFGSHVITRITHGSKLTRYVFSKSTEEISSDQFLLKACGTIKELNLENCKSFTNENYAEVAHLETSEEMTIRGGSAETRAKLISNVTPELLQKFLMEANLTDQPISVQYKSLWDLLQSRYLGTEHFVKSVNLEAYYLGYLSTGCAFNSDDIGVNAVDLKRFILVDDNPIVPVYECQLANLGCRDDADCHIGGIGSTCYCYGDGCVDKQDVSDPRQTLKEGRYVKRDEHEHGTYDDGVNISCDYHAGVYCVCNQEWGGTSWETVWPTGESIYRTNLQSYRENQQPLNKSSEFERSSALNSSPTLSSLLLFAWAVQHEARRF